MQNLFRSRNSQFSLLHPSFSIEFLHCSGQSIMQRAGLSIMPVPSPGKRDKHAAQVLSRYHDARRTQILRIRLRLTVRVNEIKHAARVLSRYRDARRTRILCIRLRLTVRVNYGRRMKSSCAVCSSLPQARNCFAKVSASLSCFSPGLPRK